MGSLNSNTVGLAILLLFCYFAVGLQPEMDFKIEPALPGDAERLSDIYFKAFCDDFSQSLLPPTEDVRAFMTSLYQADIEQAQSGKTTTMLKVVGTAPDQPPVTVAFAVWKFFEEEPEETKDEQSSIEWPPNSNREQCERFFTRVEQERKRIIGDQPHYFLDLLATDPDYGRQGLGAKLLKWGLDRADEARVITFISSSPKGRGLYEKHGCRAMNEYEFGPGYWQTSMVRPVNGLSRGSLWHDIPYEQT